jgi:rhamnosyl/mannosyltransferase
MSDLKVLHLYRTYFPETQGGLQESIRQLCFATSRLGVDNTVFALAKDPRPAKMRLPEANLVRARSWIEVASCDIGWHDAVLKCREAAQDCDVIQMHYPWPFADMLLALIRRKDQPLVVTYVSDVVRQRGLGLLYSPLRRHLLGTADRIVVSSPNYISSSEVLSRYQDKICCIPHCLAPEPQANQERVNYWRQRVGTGFFLFVGVLRYYKGLDFLLKAATRVGSQIVILGDGPEGDRLRAASARKNLANVHFLGALPDEDKYALISLCRGMVFPSHLRSEAFGIALLEAAQQRKPLITCEIGTGTTWINQHEETGLVVPPEDTHALVKAMERLSADDALCTRLGDGAFLRWTTHFSPAVVGQAYRDLYETLLKARR